MEEASEFQYKVNDWNSWFGELERFATSSLLPRDVVVLTKDDEELAWAVVWMEKAGRPLLSLYLQEKVACPSHWIELARICKEWGRRRGAQLIRVKNAISEDHDLALALDEANYETIDELHVFEATYDSSNPFYTNLLEKLRKKNRVPESANVVELSALPMNSARELLRREVLHSRGRLYELDQGVTFADGMSFGIRDGRRLVAVLLAVKYQNKVEVKWSAVDKAYRADWPLIMLQCEMQRRVHEFADGQIIFKTNPNLDPGMLRLAKNRNAVSLGKHVSYAATLVKPEES